MYRVLAVILAFVPVTAFAANTSFMGPIVPACAYAAGTYCTGCDLVALADNILKFFVTLGVAAAAVMFAYAGILYVTAASNHSHIESAKKLFFNVFIGLIFILGAYLIVDLTLRVFTGQDLKTWSNIQCVTAVRTGAVTTQFLPSGSSQTVNPNTPNSPPPAAGTLSDADARDRLARAGIPVTSSGNCTNQSVKNCTSLEGIPETTIAQLIQMKRDCPQCNIVVTGGTEVGHISHGSGNPMVDIAFDQATADFILANRQKLGIVAVCTTPGDDTYQYNCNYVETQRHLHLQFGGG